ncbi:SDR family NAD(P)-dependent oxidoreductase [Arcicella lustrica]|uniref:SDR family NAD(P)-dependent oxidoreductase n=1 Tax=Arcicella lustrica TaxID=2984196 RepID=A0ABU5SQX2_9BACT|nr:SDR family NAD(P)-dependent oxidoreductase [Arcicella sp. DC25W]MEA5429710.1 SDR family NAD(P)-dependent oxidoreductase [Arcicella sp. DC25W]
MKTILIIGAGTGLSLGVARKFGKKGFNVGLISRSESNLEKLNDILKSENIQSYYAPADVRNTESLKEAISKLRNNVGSIDVLFYNVADVKAKDILEETSASLIDDFSRNVAAALDAYLLVQNDLKENQGAVLISGGGFALFPSADYGSLSIGKAGIRSLALQLHERLKPDNVYVGLLTIANIISESSPTHSPAVLADKFWQLYQDRTTAEEQQ